MKKIIFLLTILIVFPTYINAKVNMDYDDAVINKETYVQTMKNQAFIFKKSDKYFYNDGNILSSTGYNSGGFLSLYEFNISGGKESYLFDGQYYWSMTGEGNKVYTISNNISLENKTSLRGVRITKYIDNNDNISVSGVGTYSNPWVMEINLDKVAPVIVNASTQTKKEYIKKYSVVLKVNENDNGGLNSGNQYLYCLSNSNVSPICDSWINYNQENATSNFTSNFEIGQNLNGKYYLLVKRISDKYDNLSLNNSFDNQIGYHVFGPFIFDNTKPQCTIKSTISGTNAVLTVTGTDEGKLSASPYQWINPTGSTNQVTVSNNGTYSVNVTDEAGNTGSCSTTVSGIDKVPPTCSIAKNVSSYARSIVLTVTGSDNVGLSSTPYVWTNPTGSTNQVTVTANGTFSATVTDSAGNKGSCSISVSNIDRTVPTCSLSYVQLESSSRITLTGSDNKKLAAAPYSFNGSSYYASPNNTKIVYTDGTYYGYMKDEAGNVGICSKYVIIPEEPEEDNSCPSGCCECPCTCGGGGGFCWGNC